MTGGLRNEKVDGGTWSSLAEFADPGLGELSVHQSAVGVATLRYLRLVERIDDVLYSSTRLLRWEYAGVRSVTHFVFGEDIEQRTWTLPVHPNSPNPQHTTLEREGNR